MAESTRWLIWQVTRRARGPSLWVRVGRGIERPGAGIELVFERFPVRGRLVLFKIEKHANHEPKEISNEKNKGTRK
jgi:hypothetical protein